MAALKSLFDSVTSVRAQCVVAVTLLAVMVFLLVMSNRTGQREFSEVKQRLDNLEAINIRMDGAIFLLMFELQMDFDLLTELQSDMRTDARALAAMLPEEGRAILEPVERKLMLAEEFKSEQAILRNSRVIAQQMIQQLWYSPRIDSGSSEQDLFAVERALLQFLNDRDPSSADHLRRTIDAVSKRGAAVTESWQWDVLTAHASSLVLHVEKVLELVRSPLFFEVPVALFAENQRLESRLAGAFAAAARYRSFLFGVALLLLAFSLMMVARVRRYLQMIERTRNELEDRVTERTQELASVNAALMTEIAERESVESQLRIAQKLESIGQLAAGIAHEINTPTQYVSDNVTFLTNVWSDLTPVLEDYERIVLHGDLDRDRGVRFWNEADAEFLRAEVPAALKQSAAGLQQISHIVLAMKNFSHPGSDGLQPADLNDAIRSTVAVARHEWKYVAELTLDLDPTIPPVPCNVSAFNQAVLNLIVNASQAIGEMRKEGELGRIAVESTRGDDYVEIAVADDGPGVPEEIRDRIFDPFFTTKQVGKGTGQGLAISHRVIHRQHGGTITLEPGLGGSGARFVIRLPIAAEQPVLSMDPGPLEAVPT